MKDFFPRPSSFVASSLRYAPWLVRNVFADSKPVLHAGGTQRTGQQVRAAPIEGVADHSAQSDVPIVYLDRNADAVFASAGPKGRVFVEPLQNQLLQVVVIQHSGLCASDCLCSHVPPRAGPSLFAGRCELFAKGLPVGRRNSCPGPGWAGSRRGLSAYIKPTEIPNAQPSFLHPTVELRFLTDRPLAVDTLSFGATP